MVEIDGREIPVTVIETADQLAQLSPIERSTHEFVLAQGDFVDAAVRLYEAAERLEAEAGALCAAGERTEIIVQSAVVDAASFIALSVGRLKGVDTAK